MDYDGENILTSCIQRFHDTAPTLKRILNDGVNLNLYSKFRRTPLLVSFQHNKIQCTEELLKKEANAHLEDVYGLNPIIYAAERCDSQMLELLIKYRVNLSIPNSACETPLYKCMVANELVLDDQKLKTVYYLLRAGTQIAFRNHKDDMFNVVGHNQTYTCDLCNHLISSIIFGFGFMV